jgi:hypothetical protein
MRTIALLLLIVSLYSANAPTPELLTQRRIDSLTRGIDLMGRETKVYQEKLAIMQSIKLRARTDIDLRNANTRIKEINIVLKSLAHRIDLAKQELNKLK